jgi:hypothetical protein
MCGDGDHGPLLGFHTSFDNVSPPCFLDPNTGYTMRCLNNWSDDTRLYWRGRPVMTLFTRIQDSDGNNVKASNHHDPHAPDPTNKWFHITGIVCYMTKRCIQFYKEELTDTKRSARWPNHKESLTCFMPTCDNHVMHPPDPNRQTPLVLCFRTMTARRFGQENALTFTVQPYFAHRACLEKNNANAMAFATQTPTQKTVTGDDVVVSADNVQRLSWQEWSDIGLLYGHTNHVSDYTPISYPPQRKLRFNDDVGRQPPWQL